MSKRQIIENLKQPSTWRGIVFCLSALGIALSPETTAAISAIGMGVAGLIGVIFSDPPSVSE